LNASLPHELTAVLDALLEGVGRDDLAARAMRLSATYRGGGTSKQVAGPADALAYAVARMPATYAAVAAVLGRVREVQPDFTPYSLTDIGAGPGTASWAAVQAWPGLADITMLDRNPGFRDLAEKLAAAGPAALANARIVSGDLSAALPKSDLTIACYVLVELAPDRIAPAVTHLWQSAPDMLVLAEPGTPQGFARIRAARETLLALGGHVAAPCTHDNGCPMAGDDWCHFSQRLPRSRDHMRLKAARVPFEDERYSYLVVTRAPVAGGSRIIKPPLLAKPGITLPLCDGAGLHDEFVPRRDKAGFVRVRRLGWGDLFDV
jgi:ribosomal protein RSM22 (predicted rRNA methylase)